MLCQFFITSQTNKNWFSTETSIPLPNPTLIILAEEEGRAGEGAENCFLNKLKRNSFHLHFDL